MQVSMRQYSRHRGCTLRAVQKAVQSGRIAIVERKGKVAYIDVEEADANWTERTDQSKQVVATRKDMGKGAQIPLKRPARVIDAGEDPEPRATVKAGGMAKHATGAGGEVYSKARSLRETYSAKLAQLEYQQKSGKVISLDKAKLLFYEIASTVKQNMLNIPSRISALCASETDAKKIHDILEHEIKVALQRIADGKFNAS